MSETNLLLDQVGVVGEAAGGSSVLVASLGSSSTVGGSTRGRDGTGRSRSTVAIKTGTMLAGESDELVALGALGNLDTVLVGPLLDLAVRPGVKESVGEALLSVGSSRRDRGVGTLRLLASKTRLAAESGDHGVARARLGNVVAALIEPSLEIRVRPGSVEPVTGVVGSLLGLLRSGLVVVTDGGEKRVTLAGLRNRNAVLVSESLELRVGPTIDLLVVVVDIGWWVHTNRRSSPLRFRRPGSQSPLSRSSIP